MGDVWVPKRESYGRPPFRLSILPAVLGLTLSPLAALLVLLSWRPETPRYLVLAMLGGGFDEAHPAADARFAGIGLAVLLLVTLVGALWLGAGLGRSLRRLAANAKALGDLELERLTEAERSPIADVERANSTLRAAARSLAGYARHVPRALLQQLARPDAIAVDHHELRDMTVLVTDIAGFSVISASMPAAEVAELLNGYFARIAGCVDAHGGTIDKFVGDAVFAFWGAPLAQADHAARALAAARAIAAAVRADNVVRSAPLRVRMGIDTGPLLVGQFGSPARSAYTVLGEPVNAAAHLEKLAKEIVPHADVIALASAAAIAAAGEAAAGNPVGETQARGRSEPAGVYRVV